MNTNVGEITFLLIPRPFAKPCTKTVFPAPKSPKSATTEPAARVFASFSATFFVSLGEFVLASILHMQKLPHRKSQKPSHRLRQSFPEQSFDGFRLMTHKPLSAQMTKPIFFLLPAGTMHKVPHILLNVQPFLPQNPIKRIRQQLFAKLRTRQK